ncbi:MAG TPA: heparinase II/III-family protein, partial [Candidatus Hydrogenedentes bacterium]|nr:heparinase II/III-family protein [Candidatus Hydrogenedentota bacterium]
GEIPLLNDAAFGIARPPAALLEEAAALLDAPELRDAPAGIVALPDTGFYVARPQPDDFLVFDAGPVGPDYNPGHAHSDTLSFELSLGGRRVVVDSGTFSYAADPWREYCQSTRAHNTVMIDGVEQTEKWGPWHFRVARRAKPADVDWYEHEGLVVFQGSHTGYDHLPGGPRHVRRVLLIEARHWVVYDEVWGAGDHVAESFLHFHPEVTLTDDGASWRADASGHDLRVLFFGEGAVERLPATESPPQGWYCPEFGLRLPQAVLRATARGQLPLRFGWALLPGVQEAEIAIETSQKYIALRCRFDDATYLLRQTRGGRFHRAP